MKICLLAPANNYHTQKIAYGLKNEGYDVVICTFHRGVLPGIRVYDLPVIVKPLGKINYILAVPALKRILVNINPDVLHAHYVSSYGVVAYLSHFHPFVVSVWGMDIYNAPDNILLKFLIRKALDHADSILSTSKIMAKYIANFTRKKILVTPFGVDIRKFKPRRKTRSQFVIGTARALEPKYGINYLIEAFSIFNQIIPNSELHIAGKGSQKRILNLLVKKFNIEKKVHFHGFVHPAKIPDFFASLDVFCMPSVEESESFGVAALEAQACGIPVISSNIGGLHETIVDGETGFLIPPKEPKFISDKLKQLYNDKVLYQTMARNAREFVRKKFSWNKSMNLFAKIYKSLNSTL